MFFHLVMERKIRVHPRHLGVDLNLGRLLGSLLEKDVEGTYRGKHGFVVAVTAIESIGKGLIPPDGTGSVEYLVKFHCVVMRPFKGEIIEAVVTDVNKVGFCAEAGPVKIFVSNQLMPDDYEFQSGVPPSYTPKNGWTGLTRIQKDTDVRIKIIGTRVEVTEIFCVGSIRGDYLGVLDGATASVMI